jgi:hypothetical protein
MARNGSWRRRGRRRWVGVPAGSRVRAKSPVEEFLHFSRSNFEEEEGWMKKSSLDK